MCLIQFIFLFIYSRSNSQPVIGGSTSVAPRDRPRGSAVTTIKPRARPSTQNQTQVTSTARPVTDTNTTATSTPLQEHFTVAQSSNRTTAAGTLPNHANNSITAVPAQSQAITQSAAAMHHHNHVITSQAGKVIQTAPQGPVWQQAGFAAQPHQHMPGFSANQQQFPRQPVRT